MIVLIVVIGTFLYVYGRHLNQKEQFRLQKEILKEMRKKQK